MKSQRWMLAGLGVVLSGVLMPTSAFAAPVASTSPTAAAKPAASQSATSVRTSAAAPASTPTASAGTRSASAAAATSPTEQLWLDNGGATGWMGAMLSQPQPYASGVVQHFAHADVFYSAQAGAHYVKDPLRAAVAPDLGMPISNDFIGSTGATVVSFQNGTIIWSAATGAHRVYGAIFTEYGALNWENGVLGRPTTDELSGANSSRYNLFQGGAIVWSQQTGAHAVYGAIYGDYNSLGREASALGRPTTGELAGPNGSRYNNLDGGTIIWSGSTGAHAVYGAIYTDYNALGRDRGPLGKPRTDEFQGITGARINNFEGGTIMWSPSTGAHAVYGAIYTEFAAQNYELGPLGKPVTDEYSGSTGARINRFEHGMIIWTGWTGAHTVRGAILDEYARRGYENRDLGAPITDEYTVPGGWAQDFVGGRIELSYGTFKVRTLDARCLTGRVICESKTDRKLRWVVDGHAVLVMDSRTGDPDFYTPEGTFTIFSKIRNEWSYLWNAPMPFAMYFREGGWAVHYSYNFAEVGYSATSHGCINTRDWNTMAWLFDNAQLGDKVVIYW